MFTDYLFTPKLYKVYTGLRRNDVSINMNDYLSSLYMYTYK